MATVENVIVETENGYLPNAVIENIENKIDERLHLRAQTLHHYVRFQPEDLL